jgi:hypothetical protein
MFAALASVTAAQGPADLAICLCLRPAFHGLSFPAFQGSAQSFDFCTGGHSEDLLCPFTGSLAVCEVFTKDWPASRKHRKKGRRSVLTDWTPNAQQTADTKVPSTA